ncbi:tetratricopeptide repeat protein [Bacillota bacterium Lsc_1132]
MRNDPIEPTELLIKDKKKTIKGEISRAAFYARSKVVVAETTESETYYFIYYHNRLIFGDQLEQVKKASFIDRAFREGIELDSPHPLLTAFIPDLTVSIPNRNKLFTQLQADFSPHEIAYIATTLDSFFTKEHLANVIEKLFFHYRRNGNFKKSFQILQILTAFLPDSKSANERLHSHEFYSYQKFYHASSLSVILKEDPLYVDLHCFKNRSDPAIRTMLKDLLTSKNSFVELLLLWLEDIKKNEIDFYSQMALQFVSMPEWMFILTKVGMNPFQLLPEAQRVIEKMLQNGSYETAALHLLPFMDDLPENYDLILKKLWEDMDAEFVAAHLDKFVSILEKKEDGGKGEHTEARIYQLAVTLLEEFDLKTTFSKLLPIQKHLPHSRVLRKLADMLKLVEDPDHMMELGDLYAEFKQFDQAIDCYFWEMELRPQDPDPVLKICKCYQQKGMLGEAEVYQKIFLQLKNNQADSSLAQ